MIFYIIWVSKNNPEISMWETRYPQHFLLGSSLYVLSCNSSFMDETSIRFESFFWVNSPFFHCLAALDFGAGVEQPFGCPIIQNSQAVQFMGWSMDWTLDDNMVDGLFFCATLTPHYVLNNVIEHCQCQMITITLLNSIWSYMMLDACFVISQCWSVFNMASLLPILIA